MAIALDQFYVDGDVLDVLEECDQLSIGLGMLRRLKHIGEEDWRTAAHRLEEVRLLIEAGLTY
jgi:hypothetical protein